MNDNLLPQMSEKHDIVLSSLMKAKQQIGTVKKDSKNPFHKSNYASLNAYIDASEEALIENGLILVQAGNGSFTQPLIVATLVHPESGQWIKSYLPILNPKNDSQGLGASVTYMRRYSIATLLGLVAEDDDGETASGRGKYDQKAAKVDKAGDKVDKASQKVDKVVTIDKDDAPLKTLLDRFEKEDKFIFMEYVQVVMKHFQWTQEQCLSKFLEDKDLESKFANWKAKKK